MTSFAFVLGTGRCGSTLVHEVLARHPRVGFVSNIEDNLSALDRTRGSHNNALYRRLPPRFTRKGRLRFAPSEGYQILDRSVSPILSMPGRDLLAADVTPWLERRTLDFFVARADAQRLPVFSHKFTGWPRTGFLREIFADAKFVNVVRDGRAVANSWLQMPWWLGYRGPDHWQWGQLVGDYAREWERSSADFTLLAGIAWKMLIDAFAEARAQIPESQWLDVRYEDVLADPRAEFGRMLDMWGLDWDAEFERGFSQYRFTTGRSDAFRDDLGASRVKQLSDSLASQLSAYGYPVR